LLEQTFARASSSTTFARALSLKVIRSSQQRSIDSKGILKQSELEEAPNIQEATESNSIQVSSAILQDQVTFFIIINFTNLILTYFYLDYKIWAS
jgi:hypothetical protein